MIDTFPGIRAKHEMQKPREAVERLVESPLKDKEKIAVLLAYTEAKPMSHLWFPNTGPNVPRIMETRAVLKNLGLYVKEREHTHSIKPTIHFYFGKDRVVVERMFQVASLLEKQPGHIHSQAWHREFGTALGFPQTAIEGFLSHEDIKDTLDTDVRETPTGKFYERGVMMRLSKQHWKEELAVINGWREKLQKEVPEYITYLLSDEWVPPEGGGH